MLPLIIYSVGAVLTAFYIGYAKDDWSEGLLQILFWPVGLPMLLGEAAKKFKVNKQIKLAQLESEKKKWLEAHIL